MQILYSSKMRWLAIFTVLTLAWTSPEPAYTSDAAKPEAPAWAADLPQDAAEPNSGGSMITELISLGVGGSMIAADRFLLAPKPRFDLTNFETALSPEKIDELRSYVSKRMERYPTEGVRNPLRRFYNYLNGPTIIVNADGRIIGNQGAVHNFGIMKASPEVYGDLKASERTLFGRKLPFLGKLEPTGVNPAFRSYILDAHARGGEATVVACLERMGSCQALTRSTTLTTKGRLLARKIASRGGYVALFLPVIVNADELLLIMFVDKESEIECMTNYENCGFEWYRSLKQALN